MKVKLKDVCERGSSNLKQSDVLKLSGEYPIYGAAGHIGNADFYHQEKTYIAVVKDGAGIGRATLNPAKSSIIGTMQYLLPKDNVLPEYLYYVVRNMHLEKYFTGATIPHIYFKDYKEEEFNLDSLDKQAEIISILKKCEGIINARKQEIQQLENLVKARFVEMFGDIKLNPNKYQMCKIKELLKSCEAGWSGNGTQRAKKENEVAVLKVSAVTKGYFIPDECKVLDDQKNIKKYIFPEKGDLIFSRANTREMVGATAIIAEDYPDLILPDKLWKIKFKENVNVFYMKYVLSSKCIRERFSAASTGTSGSMFNVSMEKFKSIEIPVAPFELQNQFAEFVCAIDKLKLLENSYPNILTLSA